MQLFDFMNYFIYFTGGNDSNNFRIKQEANDFDYAHEIFGDEPFEEAIVDVKPPTKQRRKSRKKVNYNLDQGEDQFNSDDIIADPNNLVNIKLETIANHEYDYKDELLGHLENFDHSELANITDQIKEVLPKSCNPIRYHLLSFGFCTRGKYEQ